MTVAKSFLVAIVNSGKLLLVFLGPAPSRVDVQMDSPAVWTDTANISELNKLSRATTSRVDARPGFCEAMFVSDSVALEYQVPPPGPGRIGPGCRSWTPCYRIEPFLRQRCGLVERQATRAPFRPDGALARQCLRFDNCRQ